MANATVTELRRKGDAAWAHIGRQVQGMEVHLDRTDTPGEWTTREVLAHLLGREGATPVEALRRFTTGPMPVLDIHPGDPAMTPARKAMTLAQLVAALDAQREAVFAFLEGLPEAELQARKVRIPLFRPLMNTDEISLAAFTGITFEFHWQSHAGQLAKIRKAARLPAAD